MLDLATATLDAFAPHVGTAFALDHPEQRETFTLVEAEPASARPHPNLARDPFTLVFDGGRTDIQFDQQILPLTHPAIGPLQIFLVPIRRNPDGTIRYEAVFN